MPESEIPGLNVALSRTPLSNAHEVYISMGKARDEFTDVGLEHLEPFAHVYRGVTGDVNAGRASFVEPDALDAATVTFYGHFAKQHPHYLANRLDNIEPHWRPLYEDPRVYEVDEGTLLLAGMAAHIGGDLGRSVFETRPPEAYVKHDYPRVNKFLWKRAHQESERFVPSLGSKRIRRMITHTAMVGIVLGREVALNDYQRLTAAKSEDEVADIIHQSHERTARVVKAIITVGHAANSSLPISKAA